MTPAAAYNNPNRPGTHLPRKTAPHRPLFLIQFLIHNPELETGLTCTKQTADPVSNRQFFAFLKLPDSLLPGPLRARQSGAEPPHSKKPKGKSRFLTLPKSGRFGMTA